MINVLLGLLLGLFLPGFFVVLLFFKQNSTIEKILLSCGFSIIITTLIAIYLGYDRHWAQKTGGLTYENALQMHGYVTAILAIVAFGVLAFKKYNKHNYHKLDLTPKKNVKKK